MISRSYFIRAKRYTDANTMVGLNWTVRVHKSLFADPVTVAQRYKEEVEANHPGQHLMIEEMHRV